MSEDKESFEDEVEAAKETERRISQEEEEESGQAVTDAQARNISLTETGVRLVGDRGVIAQVVQLMSYIRHALRNNAECRIDLAIGTEQANVDFNFDVNGYQVPDLVTPPEFRIN